MPFTLKLYLGESEFSVTYRRRYSVIFPGKFHQNKNYVDETLYLGKKDYVNLLCRFLVEPYQKTARLPLRIERPVSRPSAKMIFDFFLRKAYNEPQIEQKKPWNGRSSRQPLSSESRRRCKCGERFPVNGPGRARRNPQTAAAVWRDVFPR